MNKNQAQHEQQTERPPIVVVMGHVDHGKSTLLDYIRKENITDKEAGGITQHTYAYEITHTAEGGSEKRITFLDTPGHEAFTLMRQRGAAVADIAILVVAADDGMKEQTIEALDAIRAQEIPFIVAINKTDKADADIEKTKQDIAEHGVFVEGYGGTVPVAEISAKTGDGVPALLDLIVLVADLEGLKANPDAPAEGVVIEAHRDAKAGVSAVLVIRNGSFTKRDYVVAGDSIAPVRRIENPVSGKPLEAAHFSTPVRITGFNDLPPIGALFTAYHDKKEAQEAAARAGSEMPSDASETASEEERSVIPVVIKADAYGTLEAVREAVLQCATERVRPAIVHEGVGAISESDIRQLVGTKNALAIGFNVKADTTAKDIAERNAVTLETFSVIYTMSEWLAKELEKRRERVTEERVNGSAKIIRVFSQTKHKQVVGGRVANGSLKVGNTVKILRREHPIGTGTILELQQQKSSAQEVSEDSEFGALIEAKHDIAPGDVIEAVENVEV